MKNLTRAKRKKAQKYFKVGDVVTWGLEATSHRVIEVTTMGVIVDVTSCANDDPNIECWARKLSDGRFSVLVLFDGNAPACGLHRVLGVQRGPVKLSDMPPDETFVSLSS